MQGANSEVAPDSCYATGYEGMSIASKNLQPASCPSGPRCPTTIIKGLTARNRCIKDDPMLWSTDLLLKYRQIHSPCKYIQN